MPRAAATILYEQSIIEGYIMNDYSNIFLLSDMDGTLINSSAQISAVNRYALEQFTAGGGTFAVATGRTIRSCRDYLGELPINAPSIFYNGTIMQNVHNNVALKTLSLQNTQLTAFLAQCLIHCPQMCIELHTQDTFYIITDKAYDDPVIEKENLPYIRANLGDIQDIPVLKVQFYTENPELISWLHNFAQAMEIDKIAKYFTSWSSYFEIIPKNASKGIMLNELRKMPLYRNKIFIAVGDFDNDIEMLRCADYGIAARNATQSLKQVADIIGVSCDDHLLSHVITKIIPNLAKYSAANLQTA